MTRQAIVTGGSSGIGRSIATTLAKSGHDVGITYAHSREKAEQTAQAVESFGQRCVIRQLDLSSPETAEPIIDELSNALGGLDVFVSNAGMMVRAKLADINLEMTEQIFRVNTFGALLAARRAADHLLPTGLNGPPRENPGRIIFVTSVHETIANPEDPLYTMTKHALGGLVKNMALELSPLNITVNSVAPGEIATPMNDLPPEQYDNVSRPGIPVHRAGHPNEVAAVVDFLAGDASGFVTGSRYVVDGGFLAAAPLAASGFRESYTAQ